MKEAPMTSVPPRSTPNKDRDIKKGIILAGGSGTRLHPVTLAVSKQLLPVYNKPLIYYPLSVLMLARIRDVLVITTPDEQARFVHLLGDGSQWGMSFSYAAQPSPDGLAQAFIIGSDFINGEGCAMVLGDNIVYGGGLQEALSAATERSDGATVFGYWVKDPTPYGVASFDSEGRVVDIEEKPARPKSNYAVTGVYFYDRHVVDLAKSLKPSARGELEITDLNRLYLRQNKLYLEKLGRGVAWLDTGTHESLLQASLFIQTLEARQGLQVACPEEIAFNLGWIDAGQLERLAAPLKKTSYGQYLLSLLNH
jgi:glucose-1-phosphate thymidylyltransferase